MGAFAKIIRPQNSKGTLMLASGYCFKNLRQLADIRSNVAPP
jgi:hypothetical protein